MLNKQPLICFLDRGSLPSHIQFPPLKMDFDWEEYDSTDHEKIIDRAINAQVVISTKVQLTAKVLSELKNLKLVVLASTGTNQIDLDYCKKNNIAVANIRDYAVNSVPEHVLGLMIMLKRSLYNFHNSVIENSWFSDGTKCSIQFPMSDLSGSTLGIIGNGSIGRSLAKLSSSLGMNVIVSERKGLSKCRPGYHPFNYMISKSDIISLHCPLNKETENLISRSEFSLMKENAILINTSRGGIVNENDLIFALKNKEIAGAGLDVFESEPMTQDSPLFINRNLDNLILTPHVAWGSDTALHNLSAQIISNIDSFYSGLFTNRCDI
ncbi:D-lactate dehydrogenase [Xenorhabdus bovienii str. kraussei Quebec]|uniref:D-lactate dehydrogenase n=1 Tax=Xenorhabdus bovienii str. kraussei Quebec TaxID=1398203 RepID=A0A077PCX4_XENBV|nr:NAD(P)-dependent oxidoreductase [Xenorhabdus bovienii]CDH18948.1 D-lactate dehydrogenase [Xenorhabdus bovienii str. kraussei Quebec]